MVVLKSKELVEIDGGTQEQMNALKPLIDTIVSITEKILEQEERLNLLIEKEGEGTITYEEMEELYGDDINYGERFTDLLAQINQVELDSNILEKALHDAELETVFKFGIRVISAAEREDNGFIDDEKAVKIFNAIYNTVASAEMDEWHSGYFLYFLSSINNVTPRLMNEERVKQIIEVAVSNAENEKFSLEKRLEAIKTLSYMGEEGKVTLQGLSSHSNLGLANAAREELTHF